MSIYQLLEKAFESTQPVSDIHISAEGAVYFRICGDLKLQAYTTLASEVSEFLEAENIQYDWVTTITYSTIRLRVTASREFAGTSLAIRVLNNRIGTLEELHIPNIVNDTSMFRQGLFLVAGATGSGKSTTVSAIINKILTERNIHLVTMENPIEVLFESKTSVISQQELGVHFESFEKAASHAMHQDPDVIYFGELIDYNTIQNALTLAETGHYVIGTIHARGAVEAMFRIIDIFETERQAFVRTQLLSTLQAVCWQALIPVGNQRYPLLEFLRATPPIIAGLAQHKLTPAIRAELGGQPGCLSRTKSAISLLQTGAKFEDIKDYLTEGEIKEVQLRKVGEKLSKP